MFRMQPDSLNPSEMDAPAPADLGIASMGVMVLDGQMRVLAANQVAQHIVARNDALHLQSGQLAAIRNADDVRLKEVCRAARTSDGDTWHGLALPRRIGERNYLVSIARAELGAGTESPLHVVIVDPEACLSLSVRQLQTFFGLTPAQGALARLLGDGCRLEEAASTLGIKESTARTHLTEIFRKTNTDRIQQLVRMLATLWSATQLQAIVLAPRGRDAGA
jgi:DNA-binding CsgD family transcriptional regulator